MGTEDVRFALAIGVGLVAAVLGLAAANCFIAMDMNYSSEWDIAYHVFRVGMASIFGVVAAGWFWENVRLP